MSIIDTQDDNADVNLDQLSKDLLSDTPAPADTQTPVQTKPDWVPAKFWDAETGKVRHEDLAKSYINLESQYGRVVNDLGQQRDLTDRLLDLKRTEDLRTNGGDPGTSTAELPKVTGNDLLDNPAETIDRVVQARFEAQEQARQRAQAAQAAQDKLTRLNQEYPDWQELVATTEFQEWRGASPSRARLSGYASQGDLDAALDLLSEYKLHRSASAKPADDLEGARKASLEGGGTVGASGGGGKIFKRTDVLRLRMERPEEYYREDYQEALLKAYAEKRVRD